MLELIKDTKIDFMGHRFKVYILSGVFILAGLISIILNHGLKYGVDFSGGTSMVLKFQKDVKIDEVRKVLAGINLAESIIQQYGSEKEILIRAHDTKLSEKESSQLDKKIEIAIKDTIGKINPFEVEKVEFVGPTASKNLTDDTVMAVLLSMVGILIYVSWRFEFRYSVTAVLALFHDTTITLGIFSILGKEITIPVIAAILTLIGYSINDTIVVFDRIREDLSILKKKNMSFSEIINYAINKTLSRTTITSFTTLLSVAAILIFGGEVLKDFALALFIGIIVGTYSSIAIAAPLLVDWDNWSKKKKS